MTDRAEAADRAAALALVNVSHETAARFATHVARLRAWQPIKNLVAPSTLDRIWTRHVADSAQLLAHAPGATRWVDLGSGAGFPGLVIAAMLHGVPGAAVHLIESNTRKCAFLREVIRDTGVPAIVHAARAETVLPTLPGIEVVTSRALAPVPTLIELVGSMLDCGAIGLFLSGEQAVPGGADSGNATDGIHIDVLPSLTRAEAHILRVSRRPDPGPTGDKP